MLTEKCHHDHQPERILRPNLQVEEVFRRAELIGDQGEASQMMSMAGHDCGAISIVAADLGNADWPRVD